MARLRGVTIEEQFGAYRCRLRQESDGLAFATRAGSALLATRARLRCDLARHGIGWAEIERINYRILGPAALLQWPGQAPLMLLDEAERAQREARIQRLRALRFDDHSRMGRRPPSAPVLEDAQRLLWAPTSRPSAFHARAPQRIRVELWGLLGDHADTLYDFIAPRIREKRRALTASGFDRVPVTFKTGVLRLVAQIVNDVYGKTLPRPFTERDVRSRLQKRGRQADRRRRPDPRQDI